ncbi:hypothetical protein EJB05_35295, partial [Eragrostis curvula]
MDLVVGTSSNAVKSLASKLGSLLAQEYTLIHGVRDDIQYINDELASMQAFLTRLKRDDTRDVQRQDWMKQVREVAYDIEDCADNVRHRLGNEPRGSGTLVSLRRAWFLLTTLYARRCIATEIGNLKARAHHVSKRRIRYDVKGCEGGDGDDVDASAPRDRAAYLPQLIGTKAPVGIEDALKDLKPWFTDEGAQSTNNQLRFLAIVGIGGLGKTTLAMKLYNECTKGFDCKACVLASQKFHLPTVLRGLVRQFHEQQSTASKNDLDGIEDWKEVLLKNKLAQQLEEKRYIILVDDIWSVSAWGQIGEILPKGGSIMVTTRFKSIAHACRRRHGHVYNLQYLCIESSYKLFHETISSAAEDPCPIITTYDDDGTLLLNCTGGLPLAIIVVAGLVSSNVKSEPKATVHLTNVEKALSSVSQKNPTPEVTKILDHCYKDLPPDLKTCLLYLSMFPKGCCISRKRLIRRWIAEGFITEKHGKTIEEVAEDCFHELLGRNLIRAVNNSSNGKVKSCLIHDMVLEYIVLKSCDENFITVVGGHWQTPFPTYKLRRLSVHKNEQQIEEVVEKMKLSHVRSLMAFMSLKALHSTLHKFQILQVLDLDGCKDLSLNQMKKICNMHQMKYLSLRQTDIKEIPKTIDRLENLEVLDIRETDINKLPSSVERLQKMVHLLAGNKSKRTALRLTEGITKMRALQTLSGVEIYGSSSAAAMARSANGDTTGAQAPAKPSTVGVKDRNSRYCHKKFKSHFKWNSTSVVKEQRPLQSLENLTNLKKFTIYRLQNFTDDDDALLLSAIEHLSSCSLKFLVIEDYFTGFLDSALNASQAPPEHLQALGLLGKFSRVPKWIGDLQFLEKLTLSLTSLTTDTLLVLGELPELFSLTFSLDLSLSAAKDDQNVDKILDNNTEKSGGKIFVLAGGFRNLKLLRFMAPVLPPLSFLEEAMPELQRLELRFRIVKGVYGLKNLAKNNLQQVLLTVSSQASEDVKNLSQIEGLASMIHGEVARPIVTVDEYNES